jgi:hypothetical protein
MNNLDKFLSGGYGEIYKSDALAQNKWRIENREQLRKERKEKLKELMEKDKQQTAVEWFAQKLYETLEIKGDGYVIDSLLDLAKEMEKEKMIDFAFNFYYDFSKVAGVPFNLISENRINAEDYYDKTYGDPEQAIIDYNKMEEESEMDDYNNLGND